MRISVIVPYKNEENYFSRCLRSLTKQRGHFQFILVDDNSTDGSKAIAEAYADKDDRFVLADNENKAGVSGARNTGIKLADGDYVTFVDADDEMADNAWKSYIKAIRNDRKANILQLNHLRYYDKIAKARLKYDSPKGHYNTMVRLPEAWVIVWNKLYKRDFLKGIKFKDGLQFGEDELFNIECLAKDKMISHTTDVAVIHHFDNPNSLAKSRKEEDLLNFVHALEKVLVKEQNPEVRVFICNRLGYHWKSPAFEKIFDLSKQK